MTMHEPAPITYRQLTLMEELVRCSRIEHAVWGEGVVPPHMLRAVTHMGGLAVGAFAGEELIGFAFGFRGVRSQDGRHLHHSHVAAVLPEWRGLGVGVALKQTQAQLCRDQGLDLMTWTFDPLRARNAHLNLEKLGATAGMYEPRYYGQMFDAQNGQLDSDRLVAEWELRTVPARFSGPAAAVPRVLQSQPDGSPGQVVSGLTEDAVHVAVPLELDDLLASRPLVAVSWRESVREVMMHYLQAGYRATRFLDNGYILQHSDSASCAGVGSGQEDPTSENRGNKRATAGN